MKSKIQNNQNSNAIETSMESKLQYNQNSNEIKTLIQSISNVIKLQWN